jgi:hypothetical protein
MILLKNIKLYFIVSCWVFNANAQVSDDEVILNTIKQQVQNIQWHTLNDSDEWGFTVETQLDTGNGKLQQRIQRYNPNLASNKQWQLIEESNENPSKAMLHEYAKTQESISSSEPLVNIENVEIVYLITLKFEKHSGDYTVFSFKPRLPMFDEEVNEVFEGKLYFNKTTNYIEKLTIIASEAFSPGFSVEVEKYNMNIEVSKIEGKLHVTQIESNKSGSAFIFSSFDEMSTRKLGSFVAKSDDLETD